MSFSGYVLNGQQDNFYYISLSRLHPQRIRATKRLSESTADPSPHTTPCSGATQVVDSMLQSEREARTAVADSQVR